MIGFGRILADAREQRGWTLEEVERETRISRRYLGALEAEDLSVFPAAVQVRGFLRVYAQHVGLEPAEMIALLPGDPTREEGDGLLHGDRDLRERLSAAEPRFTPLDLPRSWLAIGGAFLAVIVLCGVVATLVASGREAAVIEAALVIRDGGRVVAMPDVRESDLPGALRRLAEAGITPLIIEVPSERVAAGLVIRQSPPPGTPVRADGDAQLIVSRGR